MDEPVSFGYWIRRRRKALDLTREALAQQVGCAIVTIRKIEADERRPSRQIAERLAECLQIPPGDRAAFLQAARAELAVDRLAMPPSPPLSPPLSPRRPVERFPGQQALKGYELHEQIGAGGFGAVYRAEQPGVGREVAVKIIRPEYANHPSSSAASRPRPSSSRGSNTRISSRSTTTGARVAAPTWSCAISAAAACRLHSGAARSRSMPARAGRSCRM